MVRFDSIRNLTDPKMLSRILGPVSTVNKESFSNVGFSGSQLERVEVTLQSGIIRNLILKYTRLEADWLSQRANDHVGREALVLSESGLSGIWNHIHCPYIGFASGAGEIGLLMNDFSRHLFPDVREPIDIKSEDLILDAIASLHASFWESSRINNIPGLTKPTDYLQLLSPGEHESDRYSPPPDKIRHSIEEGWKIVQQSLPTEILDILTKPESEIFEPWKDLPATILHGDLKIANMALLPDRKLVLFDWPMLGHGPCGIDLGWYLAVNSTRLARTKEYLIIRYRAFLESHLQFSLNEKTWSRMMALAFITGTRMMLWNKALGWHSGTQRGKDEWDWWVTRLRSVQKEYVL